MVHTNFENEIVELWEIASARLRDEHKVVNKLEELLRSKGIKEESLILDTAGGFGFPVIPLAKRGYQIVSYMYLNQRKYLDDHKHQLWQSFY